MTALITDHMFRGVKGGATGQRCAWLGTCGRPPSEHARAAKRKPGPGSKDGTR